MKALRIIVIILLFTVAINALYAGFVFMLRPDGSLLGITVTWLEHSPFQTFFIPGLLLFVVIGLLNFLTAIIMIRGSRYDDKLLKLQGVLLCGWILIQIVMLKEFNILHVVLLSISVFFGISGVIVESKREK